MENQEQDLPHDQASLISPEAWESISSKKRKNKLLFILGGILLTLLLIAEAYHLTAQSAQKSPITSKTRTSPLPTRPPIFIPTKTLKSTESSDTDTSSLSTHPTWRTYVNTTYNFTLQYPPNYIIDSSSTYNQVVFANKDKNMSEDFVFFVDEGIDEFKDETPSQVRQRTINGMTFTELHLNSGCITVHDCIFVRLRRGDNYYYAEPWIENERYQILDTIYQVLATLTFDPDHQ